MTRREDESKYFYDVVYEVWRRGGNSDQVDQDRTNNNFYDGVSEDESARREIRRQERQQEGARYE